MGEIVSKHIIAVTKLRTSSMKFVW